MPPKKHIIIIGVLGVIALGLSYWYGMPDKDSGQRAEVTLPPAPTVVTNVVTNTLKEVVTNVVTVSPPVPPAKKTPPLTPSVIPGTQPAQPTNPATANKERLLWEFETGNWVHSSPAIGPDGTVYVGSIDKKVYALSGKSGVINNHIRCQHGLTYRQC